VRLAGNAGVYEYTEVIDVPDSYESWVFDQLSELTRYLLNSTPYHPTFSQARLSNDHTQQNRITI